MKRSIRAMMAAAWLAWPVGLGGCLDGGILLTPVSGKRAMVEEVLKRDSVWAADKIAIIDVSGLILNAPEPRLIGEGKHQVAEFVEQLDKARTDDRVKGVIIRINSPGGGVVASEIMHAELQHFKRVTGKPVTALLMDVAASGGYYLACGCDEIVAQRSTVTGSIGVIMQLFDVSGTMEMIGVRGNAITSGPNKDAGSPFRRLDADERAIFQSIVDDMYERFVQVVADGRSGMDESRVRELADGRVFSATQAQEHGLIDRIAGMRETIRSMKEQLGLSRVQTIAYRRPYEYMPNVYARGPAVPAPTAGTEVNFIKLGLPLSADSLSPRFMYLWVP